MDSSPRETRPRPRSAPSAHPEGPLGLPHHPRHPCPVPPPRARSRTLARGARPPGTEPSDGSSSNSSRGGIPGRTGGAIQRGCAGMLPGCSPAPAAPAAFLGPAAPAAARGEAWRGDAPLAGARTPARVASSRRRREAAKGGAVDSLAGRGLLTAKSALLAEGHAAITWATPGTGGGPRRTMHLGVRPPPLGLRATAGHEATKANPGCGQCPGALLPPAGQLRILHGGGGGVEGWC